MLYDGSGDRFEADLTWRSQPVRLGLSTWRNHRTFLGGKEPRTHYECLFSELES